MNPAVWKQVKSLMIAGAGAGATYILAGISGVDFGPYTPVVVAVSSVLANVVKEFVQSQVGK